MRDGREKKRKKVGKGFPPNRPLERLRILYFVDCRVVVVKLLRDAKV